MSNELRAAAKRLRGLHPHSIEQIKRSGDVGFLVVAYLSEHRGDDEQINCDDILEEGFNAISMELTRFEYGPFKIDITGRYGGTCLFLNDMPICDDPTVGDVRRLFSALKIKE